MFCINCGAKLNDNAAFCRHCGHALQRKANVQTDATPVGRPPKATGLESTGGRVAAVTAAVALIAYAIVSVISAAALSVNGVDIVAEVTSMKQHNRGGDDGVNLSEQDIYYRYTVDGKVHTGKYFKRFKSGEPMVPPDAARIRYLPDNPHISGLTENQNIPATAAVSAGLLVAGVFILIATFRRKKRP